MRAGRSKTVLIRSCENAVPGPPGWQTPTGPDFSTDTRIAFLDRDGVLNVDSSYVHRPAEFLWTPGAREAISWLNRNGFITIVVTNQSGIGRGLFTASDFVALMEWVDQRLAERRAHLDAVYYCPHHPTEAKGRYRRQCEARKPGPGLFTQALADWHSSGTRSFMVGDNPTDIQAAEAAGVKGYLYTGGDLRACVRQAATCDLPKRSR